ncbi:hypothetical protein FXO37_10843 [Capsicum annuum]|nr:hypothetical protein FXO37_10843 [Capsicum annuum]
MVFVVLLMGFVVLVVIVGGGAGIGGLVVVLLALVVLVAVCGVVGGIGWWCLWWLLVVFAVAVGDVGIRGIGGIGWWCLWWMLVVFVMVVGGVSIRGVCGGCWCVEKSEVEERYENNVEGGRQRSIDSDEENESEKEEEVESQKEEYHQHDGNGSIMGRELISTSQHDPIKTISIDRFQVVMPIDNPAELTGELVHKCQLGKIFHHFRNIMKNENIDGLFKRSCFGRFLELPEDYSACFQMKMAWAFEAIPPLRKQVMDYPNEVSYLRMFRWLAAKNNKRIKETDLCNPLDDVVVHPWIVPTEQELGMTSFITLGYVDTIVDPAMELINKELAGATAIRRVVRQGQPNVEALYDQPTAADPSAFSGGVVGVDGRHVDVATTHDDEHIDAQ